MRDCCHVFLLWSCGEQQPPCKAKSKAHACCNIRFLRLRRERRRVCRRSAHHALGHCLRRHLLSCCLPHLHELQPSLQSSGGGCSVQYRDRTTCSRCRTCAHSYLIKPQRFPFLAFDSCRISSSQRPLLSILRLRSSGRILPELSDERETRRIVRERATPLFGNSGMKDDFDIKLPLLTQV